MKRVKVSTREIVIVCIMLIAVLYGVYSLFIAPSSKPVKSVSLKSVTEIDKLITDASEVLKISGSYPVYAAIAGSAEHPWDSDPFYHEKTASLTVGDLGLKYSGYLEIGRKKMAIINNVGYEIGDKLEIAEYIVKHISPSAVVIEGEIKGMRVTIPLLEE